MFLINSFFGLQILQLGMMGTSVIYSSGDTGVAGDFNETVVCLNSKRMLGPLELLSCFILTFVYEDQEVVDGTIFNPSFPVCETWFLSSPMTYCSTSVYVPIRNISRSNPNETRIYGR